ncbi:MAG: hypothetical protein ABI192_11345 [Bradyrhizobium sp.]
MTVIPNKEWNDTAKAAGGMPPSSREAVEEAVRDYMTDEGAEFRVTSETRKTLKRAQNTRQQLLDELTLLEQSSDYRRFNSKEDAKATSLGPHLQNLSAIDAELKKAEERLNKRSSKRWLSSKLAVLCIELLEIRTWHLRIDVPLQVKETARSGSFRRYLQLCLELANPHSNKSEIEAMLKKGLDVAIKSFQLRKAPEYCWQWDDLFPQSSDNLFIINKKIMSRDLRV